MMTRGGLSALLLLLLLVVQSLSQAAGQKLKVLGGLLDQHVTGHWEVLDRDLVNPQLDTISFSIQLKQCNVDALASLLEREVSNPKHRNYQNYMTKEQIDEAVSCGLPTVQAKRDIPAWMKRNGILEHQIHVQNAYVYVHEASVSQIENLFRVQMLYHRHKRSGRVVLRARGLLEIPEEVGSHALFISGLTEMYNPTKAMVRVNPQKMQHVIQGGVANYFVPGFENPPMSPRLLRRLYNVRQNLTGGVAKNSIAIAAFDDYFYEDDLCYSSDLFGRDPQDSSLYTIPQVSYTGPLNGSDNVESSLDIQFATLLAPNVSASFWAHTADVWVLTWAQQAINITTENGPWTWSISYGSPEVGHCSDVPSNGDLATCAELKLDAASYLAASNVELMKLALMGVTVFVSSGDDGAPGDTLYCPVDPSKPQSFSQQSPFVYTCPSTDPNDCKCGSFVLEYDDNGTAVYCFLPQAFYADTYNLNNQLGGLASCTLLDPNNVDIMNSLAMVMQEWIQEINTTCPAIYDSESFTFGSTCTCDQLPKKSFEFVVNATTNETLQVSLYGYEYQESYGLPIFFADFPTASPYVVSVGATQINPYGSSSSCGQSPQEILSDMLTGAFITGGGGFSNLQSRPSWQKAAVEAYLNQTHLLPPSNYFNASNRGYPDLSLNGHNYPVVSGGQVIGVDGTSASSPTTAALFTLMNEVLLKYGKKPLGLLGPLLYQMAEEEPTAFNKIAPVQYGDMILGGDSNCTAIYCCQYGYKATSSGWDPVTGLGTPNMLVIENYLRKMNGLPSIAEEAAAVQGPTEGPTSAATTSPSPSPTAAVSSGYETPKTLTTAGTVTMVVVALFLGVFGTVVYFGANKKNPDDLRASAYRRADSIQLSSTAK
eukprot:TRINITY_DN456_c0_g1_i3.p1 TRINITY_DN456_c0_g1~~TRINITY_DN456_c0_g1_i3.p1  ORF type:complete len:881 (-),score=220.63 TRINITY_DN456_c0_g1_i3:32-2674(-)